ncbi:MAG: hypothetical protein HY263_03750 [Chloroflexi bacterium]|nr:hypothetical protein [Chloroflexota bacterium]
MPEFFGALTSRETWALVHGMTLGALFLLAFGGGLASLYSLRASLVTEEGVQERTRRLRLGTTVMAVVAWLTVITGTFIVYPWYRAGVPVGTTDLTDYPKAKLVADAATAAWHNFGMEWKEHIAWMAPFLATAVAFAVAYYGVQLIRRGEIRRAVLVLFVLAFVAAGVAGLYGALITKAAPVA